MSVKRNEKRKEYDPKWESDVLTRSESAKFLNNYLEGLYGDNSSDEIYEESFVMCLNAEWGYGKTFLMKNWADDLKNELAHPVIYFDAWKNDFSDDPLLAFISELEISLKEYEKRIPQGKRLVKNVIETAKGAVTPALKTLSKLAFKKVVGEGSDEIFEMFNATSDSLVENYMKNALEDHNKRKNKIEDFSKTLGKLLNALQAHGEVILPMYIFVDELDRCKPSYAIELLEGIKHIFGTAGVFFIIAANKAQLCHSIRAIYGSEFDSITYLQRFFDQEYQIPKPDYSKFAELLINKKYRLNTLEIEKLNIDYDLAKSFAVLSEGFQLSLRAQDQVAKQLKAIQLSNTIKKPVHHWFLLFLMMFKIKNELDYESYLNLKEVDEGRKIISKNFNMREIIGEVNAGTPYESRRDNMSVLDLISVYFKWENKNANELRKESFTGTTKNRIPLSLREHEAKFPTYKENEHYPLSIGNYRQIIKQAGQLI